MLEAIEKIRRVEHLGLEGLRADEVSRVWAIHHFEILGEAATRISESVRATFGSVPWSKIIGTRNALIHGYDFIDIVRVWQAIGELPQLEVAIKGMLEALDG